MIFLTFLALILAGPTIYFYLYKKIDKFKLYATFSIFLLIFAFLYDISLWFYGNNYLDLNKKERITTSCTKSGTEEVNPLNTSITYLSENSTCTQTKTYVFDTNETKVYLGFFNISGNFFAVFSTLFFIICAVLIVFFSLELLKFYGMIRE